MLLAPGACAGSGRLEGAPTRSPPALAPAPLPPAPVAADPEAALRNRVIARIDGQPIYAGEAFPLVALSAPAEAGNAVQRIVLDRLCAAEGGAIGASVPPELLESEVARFLVEQERKVRDASKGKSDLAAWLKNTFGLEPPAYFDLVKGSLERSLLLERVVLYELGRHPRAQLRVIRVKDRALAEEIRGKLEKGADFAALARQHSEDGSGRDGGVYPPLPTDLASPLFEKTEALAPGALSPIEEVSTEGGPRFRIVQVLARLPPETAGYAERAAALEQQLAGRPLSPLELEAWMRLMEERHQIRLLGMGSDDEGA
jgi:hypothetical protein